MALSMANTGPQLSCIKIVSSNDPAVDDSTDWDEYEEELDLGKLVLKDGLEPTTFICNFELPAKVSAKIKNSMIAGKDDDGAPKVGIGDWSHTCVQYVLKDVENGPVEFKLKRDGNGKLMPNVMDQLEKWGMIQEIFNHYLRLTTKGAKSEAKN